MNLTGKDIVRAGVDWPVPAINVTLSNEGADKMYNLTSASAGPRPHGHCSG
ncbi:MAG: hypothetical protein ACLT8E_01700 [Akkermansia sp.]